MDIQIQVTGIDKLQEALNKFPTQTQKYIWGAGQRVAEDILYSTQGVRKYPPTGPGNRPPVPYYIRGRGTETAHGNLGNSEKYGAQMGTGNTEEGSWYIRSSGLDVVIGNRASYAWKLGSDDQLPLFARIGWRKLYDVATEKINQITAMYQRWIDELIKDLGL